MIVSINNTLEKLDSNTQNFNTISIEQSEYEYYCELSGITKPYLVSKNGCIVYLLRKTK